MANNRYDGDRERFEGGRGQDAGRRRDFDRSNQSPEFGGNARPDGAQRGDGGAGGNEGRGYEQPGQDWDRYRQRSMTTTYPRQNEWSSEHGISSGLGGAENSEYSSYPRSGNTYFGQSPYGGGLGQYAGPGQHQGKGPRGYKRSDERIKEDVNERLTLDPYIDATEIEVQVKDGEVTLTGTVESRQMKRRAEEMIETLSGVRDVHNQLRTQAGSDLGAHKEPAGANKGSGKT